MRKMCKISQSYSLLISKTLGNFSLDFSVLFIKNINIQNSLSSVIVLIKINENIDIFYFFLFLLLFL